ncbi:MAG: beta-lactamase family protein, partial [Calditrichia bacterium]|nr:beta-lactamase family protein [Calditrichia bacterium]
VSATVIFPDDKIWTGVSGISYDTVPIEPGMVFGIGSITKNMVAALTLKLAEENILSLDDPLSKWLSEYPFVDEKITIRQLLNHTSGLYMFWDNDQIWDELKNDRTKFWSPEEVLDYIKEPYFAPGEGWRYSNTNYLLLAMIIEKATGSNLSAELKKYFWQPHDFDNIYLIQEDSIPENQAHVYGDNFMFGDVDQDVTFLPRTSHESITYGSSGIFISSENLARWSHALFNGKILQHKSMDEMLQFVEFKPFANMRAYGLGVQEYARQFSSGKQAWGHGGGNIGTTTYMVYFPEYQVSIVVMINAYPNEGADVITKGLIRIVLKDLNAIGLIPYFEFFPTGFLIICICISVILIIISFILRRKKVTYKL